MCMCALYGGTPYFVFLRLDSSDIYRLYSQFVYCIEKSFNNFIETISHFVFPFNGVSIFALNYMMRKGHVLSSLTILKPDKSTKQPYFIINNYKS